MTRFCTLVICLDYQSLSTIFCRLLLYPGDCHPINTVFSDADSFVNTAAWFFRHSLEPLQINNVMVAIFLQVYRVYTNWYTVEPPITDSPRYRLPPYKGMSPIDFAIYFSTSEVQTTSYLRTTDRTHAHKGQVAVQVCLREQTETKISIKISTTNNSASPRNTLDPSFC